MEKINTNLLLRLKTAGRKRAIEKIANKNGRSVNSEIIHLIDMKILADKTKGTSSESSLK